MRPDGLIAEYYLARIVRWQATLDKLDAAASDRLHAALERAQSTIREKLHAEAAGLAKVGAWTKDRLATTSAWLDGMLEAEKMAMGAVVTEAGMVAAQESLTEYSAMLSLNGRALGVLPVEMSPEQLRAWFQQTPMGSADISKLVGTVLQDGITGHVLAALETGALQGLGTAAAVRSVLGTALDAGFEVSKRDAITLARTYIQTANVNAMMEVYRANSDIVEQWQWCATLERAYASTGRGTCLRCAALDGKKFKLGAGPPIPLHPRCRCAAIPVLVSWRSLGIDLDEIEDVARPYMVAEDKNIDAGGRRKTLSVGFHSGDYASWLAQQSESVQMATMGPSRFALYKAGRISLGQMVNARGDIVRLEHLGA